MKNFSLPLSPLLLVFFSLLLAACTTPNDFPPPPPGILTGHVTIGPLGPGPVQLDAPTPDIPPEVYTSRGLQIFAEDGEHLITEVKFKADGTYRLEITPGTYVVALAPLGIDSAEGLPTTITLVSGETFTLDINIDTGIR
jgi:hypothetical protein